MIIGKRVKIKWSKDEIGDSGWRFGWYTAVRLGSKFFRGK
jgi:hypothetical protein